MISALLGLLSAAAVALGAAPALAAPAVNYLADNTPVSVALGDLNGDGRLDLAVANHESGDVSVLLGRGDGSFEPATDYDADGRIIDGRPASVALGDLNRDGRLDLAVADEQFDDVSVLLGRGDGSFEPATQYRAGNGPDAVALGDLNRDGRLDLAVTTTIDSTDVFVLLGHGDGSFKRATNYAAHGPTSVALGDLNGDGRLDLAVANADTNNVSVRLGRGDGSFKRAAYYRAGGGAWSVALGDLNGDGRPDLAVANAGSDNVSVLLGRGDGSFESATDYRAARGPTSVALGDLNGDGRLDLAVANEDASDVSVLLNSGFLPVRVAVARVGAGGCVRRSAPVRVRVSGERPLRAVKVYLDGRRIARTRRSRFTIRLPQRLRAGTHRLRVGATDASTGHASAVRRFRVCRSPSPQPHFTG